MYKAPNKYITALTNIFFKIFGFYFSSCQVISQLPTQIRIQKTYDDKFINLLNISYQIYIAI